MTMELSTTRTPRGRTVGLLNASGTVTVEDTAKVRRATEPGGEFHGLALLSIVADKTEYPVEARKSFAEMGAGGDGSGAPPTAVVIGSAALRVIVNFIVKASNVTRKGPNRVKFFAEVGPAMEWLDAQLDELAAAPPPA